MPLLLTPQVFLSSLSYYSLLQDSQTGVYYSAAEGWDPGIPGNIWHAISSITGVHSSWLVVIFVVLHLLMF